MQNTQSVFKEARTGEFSGALKFAEHDEGACWTGVYVDCEPTKFPNSFIYTILPQGQNQVIQFYSCANMVNKFKADNIQFGELVRITLDTKQLYNSKMSFYIKVEHDEKLHKHEIEIYRKIKCGELQNNVPFYPAPQMQPAMQMAPHPAVATQQQPQNFFPPVDTPRRVSSVSSSPSPQAWASSIPAATEQSFLD